MLLIEETKKYIKVLFLQMDRSILNTFTKNNIMQNIFNNLKTKK